MVEFAGGLNGISTQGEASHRIGIDEVSEYRPDKIIFMPCGFGVERTFIEIEVLRENHSWNSLAAGATDATIASCLPDEVATGGGHQVLVGGSNIENPNVTEGSDETPGHNSGWFITATNPGPNDIAIRATAVCTKLVETP
jgi:hypothetical protein